MTQFSNSLFIAQTTSAPAAPAGDGAAPGGQPSSSGGGFTLLFPILLLVAMYFLMIAPQRKKQKQHQKMISELGAGDEIVTSGGIYGEITGKKEDRFIVRIADNTKVEIAKGFVQTVVRRASDAK
ncbi:preprotein translocase, YajC subunit [Opitutaceae bacterium TAV1]|nr:preprotein translocase, YajC subunit [Opitutaceae bacterium TAV1]